MCHHQIAKILGVNISTVVKVHHAIKKGQSPATPYVQKTKKTVAFSAQKIAPYSAEVVQRTATAQYEPEVKSNADEVAQAANTSLTNTQEQKPESMTLPVSEPTLARLTATPVIVQLTPLMYSAKAYLVQRRGWDPNVRWEDIIDTIFSVYFRSIGVVLGGWYEEEPDPAPKPVIVEDKGKRNEYEGDSIKPNALKQLADMVTLQIIELAHQG